MVKHQVFILASGCGEATQDSIFHFEAFARIGNIRLVDFSLAGLKCFGRQNRTEFDFILVIPLLEPEKEDLRSYIEWASTRGLNSERLLFVNARSLTTQSLTNTIFDKIDQNADGIVLLNASTIQNEYAEPYWRNLNDCIVEQPVSVITCQLDSVLIPSAVILSKSAFTGIPSTLSGNNICIDRYLHEIVRDMSPVTLNSGVTIFSTLEAVVAHCAVEVGDCYSQLPKRVEGVCPARVGFLGNPSDGFYGQTISFLLQNFSACVNITERDASLSTSVVEIVLHPEHDRNAHVGLDGLHINTDNQGYYGGKRLIQATCKIFSQLCARAGLLVQWRRTGGMRIEYDSSIPRMVGLSGSSAIVVSLFQALLRYFGLSIADLGISLQELPNIILDIERVELKIAAGLQDRVIQTFGGVVHMDFSGLAQGLHTGVYTRLDAALLPPLYLAYDARAGSDSGGVHSTVRERWLAKDPEIIAGMEEIANCARQGLTALQSHDWNTLADLMDRNFDTRLRMYGRGVVGERNIRAVQMLRQLGMAAKFSGSGGAVVCLRRMDTGTTMSSTSEFWFDESRESQIAESLASIGFKFQRITLSNERPFDG